MGDGEIEYEWINGQSILSGKRLVSYLHPASGTTPVEMFTEETWTKNHVFLKSFLLPYCDLVKWPLSVGPGRCGLVSLSRSILILIVTLEIHL